MNQVAPPIKPLRDALRPTTLIEPRSLAQRLGVDLIIATETFQHTGSFKFRAAYNVAANVPHALIITASSGNFGQALAHACGLVGKRCIVVMPETSAAVKVQAVKEFGGRVELIDTQRVSRKDRVAQLAAENPDGYVASAYDDPLVIAGNATLGEELAALEGRVDCILAPVGGGGLTSGLVTGLRARKARMDVIGVEPAIANDAARSLRSGRIETNASEPQTIADGVRTVSLGQSNWDILRDGLAGIVEVSEQKIREATRLLFNLANLKAEPTGALGIAALLMEPERFRGKRVCVVVSGGNVDPELFRALLAED